MTESEETDDGTAVEDVSIAPLLERARSLLEANDDAAALEALLDAWRARRLPRIADVVDRLSERITASRPPIAAKRVKERTAAWLERVKKHDPADLGRILETPWPGRWQDALPLLVELVKFRPDPRLAMSLAKLVVATPYDTWTSERFYAPLIRKILAARDVRTLPILAADLDTAKSTYWRQGTRHLVAGAVKKLEALYPGGALPPLDPEEETALARVEGLFAHTQKEKAAATKGEADFLAAIYDHPEDDGLRAVYADWLTERGDPRGEFIALQLARHAGAGTPEGAKREGTLLRKHGKAWTQAFDYALQKDGRVFERGFLARGAIAIEGRPETVPKIFFDPAWATFHTLGSGFDVGWVSGLGEQLFALPSFRHLRAIVDLDERTAARLAVGPVNLAIRELEIDLGWDRTEPDLRQTQEEDRARIRAGAAWPNLERLGVVAALDRAAIFLADGIGTRVRRFTLVHHEASMVGLIVVADLAKAKVKLEELEVVPSRSRQADWSIVAHRDAQGRWTRLACRPWRSGDHLPSAQFLRSTLAAFAPESLSEIVVHAPDGHSYSEADIKALEVELARFPRLAVTVPWERIGEGAGTAPPPRTIDLQLRGIESGKAQLALVWEHAGRAPLGLSFDSYQLNSAAHAAFGANPQNEAEKLLAKKRTQSLTLYRKGRSETTSVTIDDQSLRLRTAFASDPGFVEAYMAWLIALLDALPGRVSGFAPFLDEMGSVRNDLRRPREPNRMLGWLWILARETGGLFDVEAFTALAARPELSWVTFTPTAKHLLLRFGPSPQDAPTEAEQTALGRAFFAIGWERFEAREGFRPDRLLRAIVTEPLAARGFTFVERNPQSLPYYLTTELIFVSRSVAGGTRVLSFDAMAPSDRPSAGLLLFHVPDPEAPLDGVLGAPHNDPHVRRTRIYESDLNEIDTRPKAEAAFQSLVAALDTSVLPFFDPPPPPEPAARPRGRRR